MPSFLSHHVWLTTGFAVVATSLVVWQFWGLLPVLGLAAIADLALSRTAQLRRIPVASREGPDA